MSELPVRGVPMEGVIDSLGLFDALAKVPERTENAMLAVQDSPLPSVEDASSVVLVGVGAARFSANAIAAIASTLSARPIVVATPDVMPGFVDSSTLVLVIDHGEGDDAVGQMVAEAHSRGASIIAVATPGTVASQVAQLGATLIDLAPVAPVGRAALGALCVAPLVVLDRLAMVPGAEALMDHAVRQLHRRRDLLFVEASETAKLARRIGRSFPLICGGDAPGRWAAERWRQQCNVNAKIPAFASALPELAHDEIAGWGQHGDVTRQVLTSVLLRHDHESAAVAKWFERLVPIVEESALAVHLVHASGEGALAQLLDLAYCGDHVSLCLAAQERLDPGPAPAIASH